MHMHPSRDCCRGGQCGQWSPRSNLTSTPLCSPTSEPTVEGKWSLEMPSFDTSVLSSPVRLLRKPVRLLRNPVISPVISAKTMKVVKKIVPPMRKSGGQHYVDASKFNRSYGEHMALSIPIPKCRTPHESSDVRASSDALCDIDRRQDRSVTPSCSRMSDSCGEDAKWSLKMPDFDDCDDDDKLQEAKVESLRSVLVPAIDNSPSYAAQKYAARMQAEKDSLTFDNSDVLNTTCSSACNYVKPKKNRGKRKTEDDIAGADAILLALKHKVRSLQ